MTLLRFEKSAYDGIGGR